MLRKSLVPGWLRRMTYPVRERLSRIPINLRADLRVFWRIRLGKEPIKDLIYFEKRVYSQNGEDGILAAIFAAIGTTNRFCIEFGVEDGTVCNTRLLRHQGWAGLWMDPAEHPPPWIKREFVTAETVNALFDKYGVPEEPDLLSIDIDGNDYWVWKAVRNRRPRVVLVEFNSALGPERSCVIRYDPGFRWDGTNYFGASLRALDHLAREKGYVLVACNSNGVNAFFVRRDLSGRFDPPALRALYRPLGKPHLPGPPPAPRTDWVAV